MVSLREEVLRCRVTHVTSETSAKLRRRHSYPISHSTFAYPLICPRFTRLSGFLSYCMRFCFSLWFCIRAWYRNERTAAWDWQTGPVRFLSVQPYISRCKYIHPVLTSYNCTQTLRRIFSTFLSSEMIWLSLGVGAEQLAILDLSLSILFDNF